jgi:phosphatidylglycerophosphate synthase
VSESFGDVLRRLRGAQKGRARGAPAYSVYVNRRVGRYLAAFAFRAGLTPNQVTGVSAVFTIAGIAVLATSRPSAWTGVLVWLLLALGYAWDSADGQVARLRGGGSIAGEWLDHFVDAGKVIAIHLATLLSLYRFTGTGPYLLVPMGFTLVSGMTFFAMILNDLLRAQHGVKSAAARQGGSPLRSLLLLPTDYGVLCLVFVLRPLDSTFKVVYGAVFVVTALFLAAASFKWFREMQDIGRDGGTEQVP